MVNVTIKSQSPFKTPINTQSCLPLPYQASQGYRTSGKEIEIPSLARLPFLIQNLILLAGWWESFCILSNC